MRIEQFLEYVKQYDIQNLQDIICDKRLRGGWEVWLQVELAKHLLGIEELNNIQIEREVKYPSNLGRCDLFISYNEGYDQTYIELKCQNVSAYNPVKDVFGRFQNDIAKQKSLSNTNIAGFCLAVVRCKFNAMASAIGGIKTVIGASSSAYLLDLETHTTFNLKENYSALTALAKDSSNTDDFTFLLAVSPREVIVD